MNVKLYLCFLLTLNCNPKLRAVILNLFQDLNSPMYLGKYSTIKLIVSFSDSETSSE